MAVRYNGLFLAGGAWLKALMQRGGLMSVQKGGEKERGGENVHSGAAALHDILPGMVCVQ